MALKKRYVLEGICPLQFSRYQPCFFLFGDETNVPQLNLKQSKIGTEGTKTMSENDGFFWRGCFLMHCWDMRSGMSKTSWIRAAAVLTQIPMGILRFPWYIILTLLKALLNLIKPYFLGDNFAGSTLDSYD